MSSPSAPKLSLTYFPLGGRAEPIRLTCAASGIAFTNKSVTYQEFGQYVATYPLRQVPVLEVEIDGTTKVITQTSAMLRYVGKLGGMYPKDDDFAALEIDEILSVLDDLRNPVVMTIMGKVKSLLSDSGRFTDDETLAIRQRWLKKTVPKILAFLEKKLEASTSGFLVGDSLTIADVSTFTDLKWFGSGVLDGVSNAYLDPFPKCIELLERVENHEGVKKWTDKYSKPYGTFDYEP
jgi:glutathione S-transferase